MARDQKVAAHEITNEELRRAVLYVAEAVLQLTRDTYEESAIEARDRLVKALDILLKLR